MKRSFDRLVYPSLLMAWLIVAVGVYGSSSQYDFVHVFIIPLDLPRINLFAHLVLGQYVLDLLAALLGVVVFSAAALALGLLIVRPQLESGAGLLVTGSMAFLGGEVLLSIGFLTCIVIYRLTPVMVAAAFVAPLLVGGRRVIAFIRALPRPRMPAAFTAADRGILVLAVAALGLAALYSSAVLGYDSVVQYFSQPKMLAITQAPAIPYPRDIYLVSSLHSEILYTALIQTFGDQAARLLSWVNGLVLLLVGLTIGEAVGLGRRARLWFVCLMVTSTAYVDLLGDGKIELISTAFVLAAVYWLMRSTAAPTRSTFLLFGFFAGFAILARPYNILLIPVFSIVFFGIHFFAKRREGTFDFHSYVANGLWMLPPLLLLGGFHLLQNWLWLGNPLAPLIDSRYVTASVWQWQFDPRLLNVFRILYPLAATFANSPQSLGNVTPFVVGFLPFLLFSRVRDALRASRDLIWLALAGAITLVIWLIVEFTVVEIRYVLFVWVLFFLFVAQVIHIAADSLRLRATLLLRPLLIFALAYMSARTAIIALGSYSPVDRTGQAHCYFLDLCSFMSPLNESAAPGARVFVVNAYRYYLRPDLFACASRADEYAKLGVLAKQASPDFWMELYREGFRYVTYESNFATFHSRFGTLPPFDSLPNWLRVSTLSSNIEGIYGDQVVYSLQAAQAPFPSESYCQQDESGIWQVKRGDPGAHD